MYPWVALWLLLLSTEFIGYEAADPFVPDVTTLYIADERSDGKTYHLKRDPVEIHLRKNALGLPVLSEDFGFIEPQNEQQDLLCWRHALGKCKCDWDIENFTWQTNMDSYGGDVPETMKMVFSSFKVWSHGKSYYRSTYCDYYDQYYSKESYCKMYVLPINAVNKLLTTDFYMIYSGKERHSCSFRSSLSRCNYNIKDAAGSITIMVAMANCVQITSLEISSTSSPLLSIEMDNGKLQILSGLPGAEKNLILDIPYKDTINNSLHMIHTVTKDYSMPTFYHHLELLSILPNAKMSSKIISVDSEICVRIMFRTRDEKDQDQVSLTAVDELGQNYTLGMYHTNKSGYYSWKMETTLPEVIQGKPIKLELRKITDAELAIQRIASCNTEDIEQVAVISSNINIFGKTIDFHGASKMYTTPQNFKVVDKNSSSCANGGVLTDAGCACPAGFTGPNCTKGCGPNHYGEDCGGVCSLDTRECEGMKLCTPAVGCVCAPGYHGPNCENKCNYRSGDGVLGTSYGIDCLQTCGNCAGGFCNIYTGYCLECKKGYYPPLCKEKYVHLREPPVLSSPTYGVISVKVNLLEENIEGHGTPKFYQIEYCENSEWSCSKQIAATKDLVSNEETITNIEGLNDGETYTVRVVLIAEDMVQYRGDDVPSSEITTKCDVPLDCSYNLTVSFFSEQISSVAVLNWKYDLQEHWCPVLNYEISYKLGWTWIAEETSFQTFNLGGLLSNVRAEFKVRAKTSGGYTPYSEVLKTKTPYTGIYAVENLRKTSIKSDSGVIEWDPPRVIKNRPNINYTVKYQCVSRPSCSEDCRSDANSLQTSNTSVRLSSLQPMAQYRVLVTADGGPETVMFIGTTPSVPYEAPLKSEQKTISTNSSVYVFWEPTNVCSGFLQNYYYELYQLAAPTNVIQSGRTKKTMTKFENLTANTDYTVRVFVETGMGRNPSNYLSINLSTDPTVPEQVQELVVYKRGRNMLGVRWAEPRMLYGVLESFTISYTQGQSSAKKSVTIEPSHCVMWPHLYCYTIENLKPHQVYNISVTCRNKEIKEDGSPSSITALTKESSPGSPENLKMTNVTSTTMGLQWDYPNLANGVLRSFLVSVEETEQYDEGSCCQDYPIIKVPVQEEKLHYELEVSGLHPASTYSVSVSGRTVGFGPAQTLTTFTRPPTMSVTIPTVEVNCGPVWTWLPQEKASEVNTSEVYIPLIKSRFVLVLYNNTEGELIHDNTGVTDERLKALLVNQIDSDFYIAAEYNEGETVYIGSGGEEFTSDWGTTGDRELESDQSYRLAAIQVSEYNGLLNVDTVYSTTFEC